MKKILLPCLFFLALKIIAQTKSIQLNNHSFSISASPISYHGSGDLGGTVFGLAYAKFLKPRFEVMAEIGTSMHYGEMAYYTTSLPNRLVDASFRYNTTGIQLSNLFGYTPLRTKMHEFKFAAGYLVRYQVSSYPNGYSVRFINPVVGVPEPLFSFNHTEPARTISLGYQAQISYSLTIPSNYFAGAGIGFQNDTRGDAITQIFLKIGKRFNGFKK
jgi:hypothetical protein